MAEEDKELQLDAGESNGANKKKKMIIIMIIVGVIVILGAGLGAFFALKGGSDKSEDTVAEEDAGPPKEAHYLSLKAFTSSARSEGSNAITYLRVEFSLLFRNAEAMAVIEEHMPEVRNRLINVINTATIEEIKTTEGKEKLQKDLIEAIDEMMSEEFKVEGFETVLFQSLVLA
jgi:flagellar FliL protein